MTHSASAGTFPFARTSAEAWAKPRSFRGHARDLARSAALAGAAYLRGRSQADFVRCLYSHAVFPDCRQRFRDTLIKLRNFSDFIDTSTLIEIVRGGEPVSGRYFHLSFDDGFANIFEEAAEQLSALGIPYVVFVAASFPNASRGELGYYFQRMRAYARPVRVLSWEQVRACAAAGAEIGCHTMSHASLSAISANPHEMTREIADAKVLIETNTGRECRAFAFPYGTPEHIDSVAIDAIRASGFEINFSASRGRVEPGQTDLFMVPRHQIEFHWPLHEITLWASGFGERP